MVKTYWHFDHVVVDWNTPELKMKICEVLDFTKIVKVVVYFPSLGQAVLEVQFGKSKSFK